LWIVYEDKVLDITRFTDEHPGGDEVLLEVAGQDGTSKFIDADHSKDAVEMIDQYVIGRLKESDRQRLQSAQKRSSAGNNTRRIQLLCALGAGVILIGAFVVYRYIRK
uniref:Putative cytochrome b5 (inferred by orthology to a S. mansoni protein) n=1 Tax=Anisakis simplex TaxID=6269 RepID=A0A0M3K9G4_ANISI